MDYFTALGMARHAAKSRSLIYDVVRIHHHYDFYVRQYDTVPRSDRGQVVATIDCFGAVTVPEPEKAR